MAKYAEVTDDLITNIANFPDGHPVPGGWIDVDSIPADIGWPVVLGTPIPKPSPLHTVNAGHTDWEITAEDQAVLDAAVAEDLRQTEYNQGKQNSGLKGLTLAQAETWIDNQVDPVQNLAEAKVMLKNVFKKIAAFLVD